MEGAFPAFPVIWFCFRIGDIDPVEGIRMKFIIGTAKRIVGKELPRSLYSAEAMPAAGANQPKPSAGQCYKANQAGAKYNQTQTHH